MRSLQCSHLTHHACTAPAGKRGRKSKATLLLLVKDMLDPTDRKLVAEAAGKRTAQLGKKVSARISALFAEHEDTIKKRQDAKVS